MCGEQISLKKVQSGQWGSPPRVRGTVSIILFTVSIFGITPACAGNSVSLSKVIIFTLDHPRVCGEQAITLLSDGMVRGSPPRVRGTGAIFPADLQGIGITPACAGNSGRQGDQNSHY